MTQMNRFSTRKFLLVLTATLITLVATVAADRLTGVATRKKDLPTGLIFRPNSVARYETMEFNFTASTNSLGFRDREFSLEKSAAFRVEAIGDSFTYGWGVNLDDSWPKVMEADLRKRGVDVEIANLGSPGASPVEYADIAEKAVPLLKPDLLVVAILQGDDLEQLRQKAKTVREKPTLRKSVGLLTTRLVHRLYPNFSDLLRNLGSKDETQNVSETWRHQAQQILSNFNDDERDRYGRMDAEVRRAFEGGGLNPWVVHSAIKHPDYWMQTFDINQPEVQKLIDEMANQLRRIKKAADQYQAKVLVVSIPMGIYVNHEAFDREKHFGFLLDKAMLASDSQDRAIEMAAEKAGLPFFSKTDQFRKHEDAPFFFKLDGHLDVAGHRFYADQLTPIIAAELGKEQNERTIAAQRLRARG
jgi:lysophospholipase L1-like esterase